MSKEQAILDAVSELFLQRGFKSVSIGEIMQEAACSRETTYRYFSGKEDIFVNIISRQMDAYPDTMMIFCSVTRNRADRRRRRAIGFRQ